MAATVIGSGGSVGVEVSEASIDDLQHAMAAGDTSARELVDRHLARIEAYDAAGPRLTAMISLSPTARDEAEALDRERAADGPRGPLHGIPIVVKDNHDVAGLETTAGSRALRGLVPERDAFVVARLREAGAVVLGKTNLHELAAGITTESSAGGATRNPYDLERNAGGSSGGTAAAVAASFAVLGMGSDTCGSIRIPAARTALVGLRPSQGLTSRSGVVPLCLTQDVVGPLARSVRDLAIALDAVVGADPADPETSVADDHPQSFAGRLDPGALRGKRIGRLDTLFDGDGADPDVGKLVRDGLERASVAGAEIVPIDVPELPDLVDAGFVILLAEFERNVADYLAGHASAPVRTLREILDTGLLHPTVSPIVQASLTAGLADGDLYRAQLDRRATLRARLTGAMDESGVDLLAYPTIQNRPSKLGEVQAGNISHASANSGMPAVSVPIGFAEGGMPVGVDLLGRPFRDAELLAYAYAFEQAHPVRRAPDSTPALG